MVKLYRTDVDLHLAQIYVYERQADRQRDR